MPISETDTATLEAALEANPFWFRAMILAAEVMAVRRQKYSGEIGKTSPHFNFRTVARVLGSPVRQVFRTYQALKFARLLASDGDFQDESLWDTLRDLANYALLEIAWEIEEQENVED